MARPIRAEIDCASLEANLALARRQARQARVMAVVKAEAYGHGLLRAARALARADGFGILEIDKAVALREAGYRQTILLLEGFFSSDELPLLEEYRLAAVVHCREQLAMLKAWRKRGRLDVFLKLNTGMNRLGFPLGELGPVLEALKSIPSVAGVTLMTHFACADEPGGWAAPLARFEAATRGLRLPRSLANSAALLACPEAHGDWVRPGILLYGASPFPDRSAESLGLKPVMTLKSRVIAVQQLMPGDRVGYGGAFAADHPMRVGVVACGYADGYPRHADTGTPVLVEGCRTRTLGRVSMDMLCVDLTRLPNAGIGSEVILWGRGLPVEEVAQAAGTISYELLCAVAQRVPMVEV